MISAPVLFRSVHRQARCPPSPAHAHLQYRELQREKSEEVGSVSI
jgi:hypothetical protein